DVDHEVKGTPRGIECGAVVLEQGAGDVAPPAVGIAHGGNAVLRALQRRLGRLLGDGGGTGDVAFLDLVAVGDDLFRGDEIAQPPTGHGVGLGEAEHADDTRVVG